MDSIFSSESCVPGRIYCRSSRRHVWFQTGSDIHLLSTYQASPSTYLQCIARRQTRKDMRNH